MKKAAKKKNKVLFLKDLQLEISRIVNCQDNKSETLIGLCIEKVEQLAVEYGTNPNVTMIRCPVVSKDLVIFETSSPQVEDLFGDKSTTLPLLNKRQVEKLESLETESPENMKSDEPSLTTPQGLESAFHLEIDKGPRSYTDFLYAFDAIGKRLEKECPTANLSYSIEDHNKVKWYCTLESKGFNGETELNILEGKKFDDRFQDIMENFKEDFDSNSNKDKVVGTYTKIFKELDPTFEVRYDGKYASVYAEILNYNGSTAIYSVPFV